jgi:hypothetical protein
VPVFTRMRYARRAYVVCAARSDPCPAPVEALYLRSFTLANVDRHQRERHCQHVPNGSALRDHPSGHSRCALAVPLPQTFAAALKRLP